MSELVTVKVTPQGTADVYIGELHIKTFGGKLALQAANDFAQQIKNEISNFRERRTDGPRLSDIERTVTNAVSEWEITNQGQFKRLGRTVGNSTEEKADDYKLETKDAGWIGKLSSERS